MSDINGDRAEDATPTQSANGPAQPAIPPRPAPPIQQPAALPPYGAPGGYAANPAQPARPVYGHYTGQAPAAPGSAFGTQPTLPLNGASASHTPAERLRATNAV